MRSKLMLPVLAFSVAAYAHQQPTTLLSLEPATSGAVLLRLHLPLPELELANAAVEPLPGYLQKHIRAVSAGRPWGVEIVSTQTQRAADQPQTGGPFDEAFATVRLTPPSIGESPRKLRLFYDAIVHQVVTHKVIASMRNRQLGVIRVNLEDGRIAPLDIDLDAGGVGFGEMIQLGAQHIREGADHLLFLFVLLLAGAWNARRILGLVTAFTAGHSLTLLVAAMGWLQLPQQPVEVLIAVSILIASVHAMRPILHPRAELAMTAGFGLVHGLGFASGLTELPLDPAALASSIVGFNLGIEGMQLLAIAMLAPWLVLLRRTPRVDAGVRLAGAAFAACAAVVWILHRVSGEANVLGQFLDAAPRFAPAVVLLLAVASLPAWLQKESL